MIPYDFFGMKIYMFKIPPPTPSKGGQNNATKKPRVNSRASLIN